MDIDSKHKHTAPGQSDSGFLSGGSLYLSANFQDMEQVYSSLTGYSHVFRAQRMGKWHTLKCLKPEYADKQEYRALLQKEFELGYHLDHPNIVHTLGMEEVEGLGTCIVMEYVEGRTLRKAIDQGLTKEQSLDIVRQLCLALSYIHHRQIIHRDLKPENVMLTYHGHHVKLMDFGLSDSDEYAILKQPAGTPRYAAPEQLKADGTISPCTDLYALGIIMQELPHLPRSVKRIAKRCCKSRPEERYQAADEVMTALAKHHLPLWRIASVLLLTTLMLGILLIYFREPQQESPTLPKNATAVSPKAHEDAEDSLTRNNPSVSKELAPSTSDDNEEIAAVATASTVSPDVAFFLSQTDIPKDVQHEERFVHLAEYAYSITMHFMKTKSINANAEREAFGYVQKEINKKMGKDKQTADRYLRYLNVLTQIIADDYRQEHLSQSAADSNAPSKEILHRIEVYAEDRVPFLYAITNLSSEGPSTTNEAEVLADMDREVQHLVGQDNPFYPTYIKHAHAAAQKMMSERRELWKASGQWSE